MMMTNMIKYRLTIIFVLGLTLNSVAYAKCNFATDIKIVENGVLYSNDCHKAVGKIVKDNEDRKKQIISYKELLDLKNLQIDVQRERADLWYNTSKDLESRIHKIDRYSQTNKYLHFAGGVLMTVLAAWSLGQVSK